MATPSIREQILLAVLDAVRPSALALGIHEQECEWDVEDADAVAATIPARYAITYRTLDTDLSTQG